MHTEVRIPVEANDAVHADVVVPRNARGLVIFAHGSGSSRHSPRNVAVAEVLQDAGLATLLLDLLTKSEEQRDIYTREHRFDIPLLATRLVRATEWAQAHDDVRDLPIGYFGASTGSAAALVAAARQHDAIAAVVSRGGRPDLAGGALRDVDAATLLIVGANDQPVIALNQCAYEELHCEKDLVIVPGATHLFEEPGTLERVSDLATAWFARHLVPAGGP